MRPALRRGKFQASFVVDLTGLQESNDASMFSRVIMRIFGYGL
jgi:hypothetical protein